ncbi:hypothetical protein OAS95_05190, partial [Pelagibacteraceae bacterium]|nr:hypothetical protein [Pelagibacteraceae bacterium]
MSARTPDFYIGISTQNPPTIISIGQTIDGMEEIEVRLDQPDENKLADFENKINNISTSPEQEPAAEPVAAPAPAEEPVAAPAPAEEPAEEPVVAPVPIEEKVAPEPVDILPLPPANDSPEQLPPTPPIIETCNATERDIIPSEDCNPNTQKPKPRSWLRFHPDKNSDCRDIATEKFKELTNTCEKYTPVKEHPEEKVSVAQEVSAVKAIQSGSGK